MISNGGFVSGNSFVWGSVGKLGLSFVGKTADHSAMRTHFKNGNAVMLNVNNGGHWVLMTGISGTNFLVNDPGFSKSSYTQGEVVNSGVFKRPAGCSTKLLSAEDVVEDISLFEMEMTEFETLNSEPSFLQFE